LAVDQGGAGFFGIAGGDHAALGHFQPEVVTFAGALADAGEDRDAAVFHGDVVDEFHDEDGFAYARATEEADFAAF
jgi:hypothetical protein